MSKIIHFRPIGFGRLTWCGKESEEVTGVRTRVTCLSCRRVLKRIPSQWAVNNQKREGVKYGK